jgi:hypothetical protein
MIAHALSAPQNFGNMEDGAITFIVMTLVKLCAESSKAKFRLENA